MTTIGVDLGFQYTKNSKRMNFLSKVSKSGGLEEKGDYIILDNEKLFLGEGEFITEYRKAYKKDLLQLLYGSLALATDSIRNKVVVGLPLNQYKQDKDYLKQRILSNNNKSIELNGVEKRIIIEDCIICPEGVVSVDSDFEGIVVDIGGRTTDIALIIEEEGRNKILQPYSINKGMMNLESDYINIINRELGLDLTVERDINRILKSGLKIYGEQQNIDFAMEVFKAFVEKIVNEIQVNYSVKTYDIALVGGGSSRLFTPIKKRLPNSFLIEDSFYSNANAYKEVGDSIWH